MCGQPKQTVTQLILYHDADIEPRKKHIKRWLNKIGEERFRQLLEVKRADTMAQAVNIREDKLIVLDSLLVEFEEIIAQQQCFSLKDLAVNGRDLIEAGIAEGKQIGIILNKLMDMVIDEEAENDRVILLGIAKKIMGGN